MHRLERLLCEALKAELAGRKHRRPDAGTGLRQVFIQLSAARSYHAHGPNPISFPEIEAYCRLMRLPLRPEHVGIIQSLDRVWMADFYHRRDGGDRKAAPPVASAPINRDMFDAMFG